MFAEGTQTPLETVVVLLCVLILHEVLILLIDRVVSQMHVLVVLVNFRRVCFRSETGETLLENINTQRFITSNQNVDAEVELVTIDQKRVCHVTRYDRSVVHIHIVDVVNNVDTLALAGVGRLNDPYILLRVMLLEFLVMSVEISKLIRKDVGIRDEVKVGLAKFLLHANHIIAQPVFPSDFITLREMIDLLIFVQAFIEVGFAAA
jgi:hypothetical protein